MGSLWCKSSALRIVSIWKRLGSEGDEGVIKSVAVVWEHQWLITTEFAQPQLISMLLKWVISGNRRLDADGATPKTKNEETKLPSSWALEAFPVSWAPSQALFWWTAESSPSQRQGTERARVLPFCWKLLKLSFISH